MKAIAVFPETRELKLIDSEEPTITEPAQVKLRMLEVGICGTDKEICSFEYGTPPEGSDHLIIGHESLGEVVETGPAVDDIKVGDLVVTMVRRPCAHAQCRPCQVGFQDFCSTGDYTERGIKGQHGFMAELVVDEARYMTIVPQALRGIAVLVEPLTICTKGLFEATKIMQRLPWFDPDDLRSPGDRRYRALVLGAGAVGLLGAMALRTMGFETYVYARTPAPNPRSEVVETIGATYASTEDASARFAQLAGSVDIIFEAVGASQLAFRAMQMLGPNSIFVLTGVPALKDTRDVDVDLIMRNAVLQNQVILGTVNAGRDAFQTAIRMLDSFNQRWPQAVRALISGRYPLDAYRDLLLGQADGIKNVLTFDATPTSSPTSSAAESGVTPHHR